MARVEENKLILSKEENDLLKKFKELELIPNQEGIFLLIDKEIAVKKEGKQVCVNVPLIEEQEQVIGLIKKSRLNELVEGKFEEKLNEKQKKALLELVVQEKVFVFKLNDTYKKGVYRVKEETLEEKKRLKKDSEEFNAEKKSPVDYTLEKDGFLSTTNTEKAKSLSYEFKEKIEEGELKGIKNFEGTYYLIETNLLGAYSQKINQALIEKELSLPELAKQVNISEELTKIICEFLKEEGEIIEKRKGKYQYIK